MTALRKLNKDGINAFREYLASIRAGASFQSSPALLYVDEFSTPVAPRIEIEARTLKTKLAAAKYLTSVLEPIDGPPLSADVGLWSWLALFYFDQLSPMRAGKRRPREDYYYIPSEQRPQRHLLAGAFQLYRLHGEHARVLLHPPVHQHGRFLFDLDYRRDLLTNRGLIEVIDRLYWNDDTHRPKRGAASDTQPGSLRRLIAVIQQLDLNYDLYGMSAPEIEALLPMEFDAWRNGNSPLATR
ncbi:MAG: hypothetical protein QOK37_3573 [Thermoanaerobaculia bacterium]|nr:hypothetical protein [Thermoanaerobaculia bacterium]